MLFVGTLQALTVAVVCALWTSPNYQSLTGWDGSPPNWLVARGRHFGIMFLLFADASAQRIAPVPAAMGDIFERPFHDRGEPFPEWAPPPTNPLYKQIAFIRSGWPLHCLEGSIASTQPGTPEIDMGRPYPVVPARGLTCIHAIRAHPLGGDLVPGTVPIKPLLAPLIVNAAFFGALTACLLWVSVAAWKTAVRAYWASYGLCPNCGYERRGLPINSPCPECGR